MSSNKYTTKLVNTRVFVLGGTSGIGFAVAEAAMEYGAVVTVASSTQSKIDKTITRLQASYPHYKDNILGCLCDLSDTSRIEENVEQALKYSAGDGKIDHVVVTATPPQKRPQLDELTVEAVHGASDGRTIAALMLAKHAKRYMNRSAASSFSMTSGVRIDKPQPGTTVASGLASAIHGLTLSLAVDLKPIRVNTVSPGLIYTELIRTIPNAEAFVAKERESTTTGTVGRPEDTAEAYLSLMKDQLVTGTIIRTNGGRLLA